MRIQNGEMEMPSVSFDENDEEQGYTSLYLLWLIHILKLNLTSTQTY